MEKGYCPYCKRSGVMLLHHHLDYETNLTVLMCVDCHYKEHFPDGKKGKGDKPALPGDLSNKQILKIDNSGHFGLQGGEYKYISRRHK